MEKIDIVSPATGAVIGEADRSAVHAQGSWHQVFHCLVLRPSNRSIVLQRRAATKAAFPNQLDLSVTGHLAAGETPLDGLREFEEELGVPLDPDRLISLGTRLLADDNGEGQNRERVNVFFVLDDRPIQDYRPPLDEVAGLVDISAADLLQILQDPAYEVSVPSTATDSGAESIRQSDLVEGTDGYWVVLAVMAQRALDGHTLLSV